MGVALHDALEQALCDYLGVEYLSLVSSGTTAPLMALKALRLSGEVITTPYTFAATSHALLWSNIKNQYSLISNLRVLTSIPKGLSRSLPERPRLFCQCTAMACHVIPKHSRHLRSGLVSSLSMMRHKLSV